MLLTVNNFINGKLYSLVALYKDDIAVYTCDHNSLNFLRVPSPSIRIKQTWKFSNLEIKNRNGKLITCNEKLIIKYLSISK